MIVQQCSENGQFCAIKEVEVIMDDPHSKERLKQLNQVLTAAVYLGLPSHECIFYLLFD
jgi:hypothetical protein